MTMPYRLAEVLGTARGLELGVAHVPHAGNRPWVGLALADDGAGISSDGLLSVVLQGAGDVDIAGPLVTALASSLHLLFVIMAAGSIVALAAALFFPHTSAATMSGNSAALPPGEAP